jgi:hypothetical protein
MRLYVQDAKADPEDWYPVESADWQHLDRKPIPRGGERLDNRPGWLAGLSCQGVDFSGYDHVTVRDLPEVKGCEISGWLTDPEDQALGAMVAHVWTFLPPAPDPAFRGRLNTRQQVSIFVQPRARSRQALTAAGLAPRALATFQPSAGARHGIWIPDELWDEHLAARRHHGWREWWGGPPEDVAPYEHHSITYILRNVALSTGVHAATRENEMNTTAAAVASVNETIGAGDNTRWVWTSASGSPGSADWANALYSAQLDVSAAGASHTYGMRNQGTGVGHFGRVNTGLTADLETIQQTQAVFSGTGLKLGSATWDPAAGASSDRFEVVASLTATVMSQTTTFDYNTTDSFAIWEEVVGGNVTVTPGAVAMTMSVLAPTPRIRVLPGVVAAALTAQNPTPRIRVKPSAVSSTLAVQAPTPRIRVLPSAVALAATVHTPTAVKQRTVTHDTVALTLAALAPLARVRVLPGAVGLTATVQQPTPRLRVNPSVVALSLTAQAPTPRIRVLPSVVALTLTAHDPTATIPVGGNVTVTPSAVALALTVQAALARLRVLPASVSTALSVQSPTVRVRALPSAVALSMTAQAPTALKRQMVTPAVVALSLSALAPLARVRVLPGAVSLALSAQTPRARLGTRPGVVSLSMTALGPKAAIRAVPTAVALALGVLAATPRVRVLPGAVSLAATVLEPTVFIPTGVTVRPGTVALVLSVLPATAVTLLFVGTEIVFARDAVPLLAETTEPAEAEEPSVSVALVPDWGGPFVWGAAARPWGAGSVETHEDETYLEQLLSFTRDAVPTLAGTTAPDDEEEPPDGDDTYTGQLVTFTRDAVPSGSD